MSKAAKVFFFGPLPPPTHGMAVVNAQMVELMRRHCAVVVADTSPGRLMRGAFYHARKAVRVLCAIPRMMVTRLSGCRTIYGSPDDNLGGIWTAALLLVARFLGMRVVLHHHSYRYLLQRTLLMRIITGLAGASARHVVLGRDMGERLSSQYPAVTNVTICENSVTAPDTAPEIDKSAGLTIGILANLTVEKGALDVIRVFEAAVNEGLPVRAVLAGPITDPEVEASIQAAKAMFGRNIEARGAVHGEAKEQLFADIDLFLFPTRYPTEAFPLVLMESLVRGVPVLAYRRGCIGALDGQNGVELVDPDDDFIAHAVRTIRQMTQREAMDRAAISRSALDRNAANLARLEQLAAEICGVEADGA